MDRIIENTSLSTHFSEGDYVLLCVYLCERESQFMCMRFGFQMCLRDQLADVIDQDNSSVNVTALEVLY